MPVQTRIKPKIKQQEASETEPSLGFDPTPCDDCGKSDVNHLIEAYDVNVETNLPTAKRKDLCGDCLVGHDVAVCRSSDNSWCFGEVKEYDASKPQPFLMTFLDDKEEWCVVCRRPSFEYLFHVGNQQLGPPSPLHILAQQSTIGSFSQSSFSSASTNEFNFGNEIMPLFEESRLLHMTNSFTSFEGSIYSDGEGNIEIVSKPMEVEPSTPQNEDPLNTMEFEFSTPKNAQFLEVDHKPSAKMRVQGVDHKPSALKSKQAEAQPSEQTYSKITPPGRQKRKQKKSKSPVKWSAEEDRNLVKVVESFKSSMPVAQPIMKWNKIAEQCPNRNGKQCRERYVNHLSKDVKKDKNWSPLEDVSVFSGFFRLGTKWNDVAQTIRGRTDNHVKNRFHSLRRKLTNEVGMKTKKYSSTMKAQSEDEESVGSMNSYSAEAIEQKARKITNIIAADSQRPNGPKPYLKGTFGPFVSVTEHKQCMRCCLYIPSAQTGKRMCTTTLWCEACTTMPPYLAHDLLRECLNLRKEDDPANK